MSKPTPDHARGCEGRSYTCACGYDAQRDEALHALEEENARLRETVKDRERKIDHRLMQIGELKEAIEEALKVIEPFAKLAKRWDHLDGDDTATIGVAADDLRAARRFMEENR